VVSALDNVKFLGPQSAGRVMGITSQASSASISHILAQRPRRLGTFLGLPFLHGFQTFCCPQTSAQRDWGLHIAQGVLAKGVRVRDGT
jgi:hypothetical protein